MNEWHVYMVRTRSNALYTGITTDVARRVAEHAGGGRLSAKSLRASGPVTLEYSARIGPRGIALKVEYRIKRLRKAQKEALVRHGPAGPELVEMLKIDAETAREGND